VLRACVCATRACACACVCVCTCVHVPATSLVCACGNVSVWQRVSVDPPPVGCKCAFGVAAEHKKKKEKKWKTADGVGWEHHTPASKRMARSNARCTEFAKSFGKKLFEVKHLHAKTGGQLRSAEVVVNTTGDLYDTLDNGDHFGQNARVESRHVNPRYPRFWLSLFVVLQLR
jgi:hypothetical protein